MSSLPSLPRSIRLRSFYGFSPEEDGYLGWTEEAARDRMLGLIQDGDLFMIYGADSPDTERKIRKHVIGFLQVAARTIRDVDKASHVGMQIKRQNDRASKWSYAIPVVRAWRVDETVLLESIARTTYRADAGQAIAVWNPELTPDEIDLALKIKVTEVNVFGEPPIADAGERQVPLGEVFRPSRAFPASFGQRSAEYVDGATFLYLALFSGDASALLPPAVPSLASGTLMKIGVTNDMARRTDELNSGFPPSSSAKWKMDLRSEPFDGHEAAEAAERMFKDEGERRLRSLGGEFFYGDLNAAQSVFAAVPGVSRFGKFKAR